VPTDDLKPHWIYVIQIAPKWVPRLRPSLEAEVECLYVGESEDAPRKRFHQHRRGHTFLDRGGDAAARPFRRIKEMRIENECQGTLVDGEDAWLRRDLMEVSPVFGDRAAKRAELETAERLRSSGFFVYGPKLG